MSWPTNKHIETRSARELKFLNMALEVHGNKYDYTKVIGTFKNVDSHVEIVCNRCGKSFMQSPYNHIRGSGCKSCNIHEAKVKPFSVFLEEANRKHGSGNYDYSQSVYKNTDTCMDIMCMKCNMHFKATPHRHLHGQGCGVCQGNVVDRKTFEIRAKKIHQNFYDYSLINYVNGSVPINIRCNRCNQCFVQIPNNHLNGHGCPSCAYKINGLKHRKPFYKFVEDARSKHGDKFEYIEKSYSSASVEIYCKKHDITYFQNPHTHIVSHGCRECGKDASTYNAVSYDDWMSKVLAVHGNYYDYSLIDKNNFRYGDKLKIICKKHGEFLQLGSSHTKHGCSSCAFTNKSKMENEWLTYMGIDLNNRQLRLPNRRN